MGEFQQPVSSPITAAGIQQAAADALAAQQAAAALAVKQAAAEALAAQLAADALAAQQAAAGGGSGTAAQYFTKNAVGNRWTFLSTCTGPYCWSPAPATSTITAFAGGVATIQTTTSGISSTSTNQIDATGAWIATSSPFTYTVASMTFTIPGATSTVLPATFSVGTSWEIAPAKQIPDMVSGNPPSSVSATISTIAAFNVARTVPGGTFTDCLQINTTSTTTTTIAKTTNTTTSYYSPTAGTNVEMIYTTISEYTGTDAAMAAITNSTMITVTRLQAGYVANP